MNANRKADLQRKLALAPLPKPPAGLVERIKSDIPKQLRFNAEAERERLSRSVAFSIRVAASILVVISSAYLVLNMLTRMEERQRPPAAVMPAKRARVAETSPAASGERSAAVAQEPTAVPKALTRRKAKPQVIIAEAKKEETTRNEAVAGAVSAAPAGVPPPAVPAAASAAKVVEQPVAVSEAMQAPIARDQLKVAKSVAMDRQTSMFGIDVDRQDYDQLAASISRGKRPPHINIAALVQHFASPASPPIRDVRLEAEAAVDAIDAGRHFLRVSIDSAVTATDASIAVDFGPQIRHRALVGESTAHVPVIGSNSTVTLLYEFAMRKDLERGALIATVRLRYRFADDTTARVIDVEIRNADVSSWADASSRTKSAVLAASLGEALRDRVDTAVIATEARNAGLGELAALAEKARL